MHTQAVALDTSGHWHLHVDDQSSICQLKSQTRFVGGFKKTGSDDAMNLNRRVDDHFGDLLARTAQRHASDQLHGPFLVRLRVPQQSVLRVLRV